MFKHNFAPLPHTKEFISEWRFNYLWSALIKAFEMIFFQRWLFKKVFRRVDTMPMNDDDPVEAAEPHHEAFPTSS